MWPVVVVILQPEIEVDLQLLQRCVEGLAESRRVELILQGLVEALADPVGLRMAGLGAAVIDILDGQVQLIFVMFARPAVFSAAIGQHS